ncbi:SprT-like domain-containing protein [Georgenia sp. TF02-10]|uniref:SprT-like domain-containing protein n=1 Tax=Georgenia sp. TF02-10 TaxID=2917725 RepID=UPI001FA800BC|nr:SprT-like domain-containing protein [Georgenia sp. TF02-10]UNX55037.1 SprT-like domain-containing protein [Georgenia sp. TF02-10]
MELAEVRRMGTALLAEHGLAGWRVALDGARVRAGSCRYAERTITLSRHLMALYDDAQVRETLLHEIAHALVGPEHGHDAVWRAKARAIGSTASRTVAAYAPQVPAPWRGTCPRGHVTDRHRRPVRPASCSRCDPSFNIAHLLTWTYHGRPARMGERYARELAALQANQRELVDLLLGPAREEDTGWDEEDRGWDEERPGWDEEDDEEDPGWDEADGTWDQDGPWWERERAAAAARVGRRQQPAPSWARAAVGGLRPGTRVRLVTADKYRGLAATVFKTARTRYHVRTDDGRVLTVPFPAVVELG